MPGATAKPTIMRWYGAHIDRNNNCSLCSYADIELDGADELLNQFGHLIKNTGCDQSFTKYIDPLARSSYTIETIME